MKIKLILSPKNHFKKYRSEYGQFINGEIRIYLFNFPRNWRRFIRLFVKTINHEFTHYFISKYCRKEISLKVEEKICEMME